MKINFIFDTHEFYTPVGIWIFDSDKVDSQNKILGKMLFKHPDISLGYNIEKIPPSPKDNIVKYKGQVEVPGLPDTGKGLLVVHGLYYIPKRIVLDFSQEEIDVELEIDILYQNTKHGSYIDPKSKKLVKRLNIGKTI